MTHRKRLNLAAAVLVLLFVTSTVAAQSKFQSSQETGGAPGRYRVEVELRPGDDLASITGQLAATYGARIEPFAEEGFTGFAIMATPTRARLMSNDPRVVAITDLSPPGQPAETVAAVQPRTASPVAEQVRTVFTSEAVPGFGNYSYDGSGNITSIDNHVFRYDAFGRLQNAFLGGFGSQAYTYDRYGNILKIVRNGDDANAARMSVDPETNQMDLPFSPSNPANMIATYDGVGNVITHNGSFVYDVLNMMKETTDTARRLHVYSASDERVVVIQVANGLESASEWALRDGANRMLRRFTKDTGGVWYWKEDYIYGGTRLLAAEVPGTERVRHFHVDHLGSPRLITGNGGVRIAEKTYEPFGRKVSTVTADFEQLEFTGHERDTPALDYMHARYYQPDLGRFLSADPGKDWDPRNPQSWNMYAYVRNNPTNRIDPTGRCGEEATLIGPKLPCAQSSKPQPQDSRTPAQGQEPGTQEFPDGRGGKTVRTYGPDGRAVIDVDYGHGHDGAPDPHVHDWDWDKKPPRSKEGRAPKPGEIPEPSQSTTVSPRRPDVPTIIGATIMAIGGTALMLMTGGTMTLQPATNGIVIAPANGFPSGSNARDSDCPPMKLCT